MKEGRMKRKDALQKIKDSEQKLSDGDIVIFPFLDSKTIAFKIHKRDGEMKVENSKLITML